MATCDLGYEHEDQPEVVIEEAPDTEPIADASVEIARIEADRDVTVAKIAAKMEESHDESEVEVLRAEISALREMVERVAPAPEPEPVVVMDAPPVADEEPELPAPEPAAEPKPRSSRKNPWW